MYEVVIGAWADVVLLQSHNFRPGTISAKSKIVPDPILMPEHSLSKWSRQQWQQIEETASLELSQEYGDEEVYSDVSKAII